MKKKFKFKEMNCPVCDEFRFDTNYDPEEKAEDLREYEDGEVRCSHCGWIYDLGQTEDPDSHDGYNKLSLNEYRKEYEAKVKENPKYDWFDEHRRPPKPHPCPVCGEYTFPDEDSFDICPVCGWEDDGMEDEPDMVAASGLTYPDAVKEFRKKRAENPKYRWEDDFDPK